MPISKKRKKKGKQVQYDEGAKLHIDPNKKSTLTLQDLINVVAYQEYVKDGTIDPENTKAEDPKVIDQQEETKDER